MTLPSDQDASGRSLGAEEIALVEKVIRSGTLTSTKGPVVKELEKRFADMIGVRHSYACSSGSAAIHVAVAAIDPEPGDEIVTTSITDMGALTPILYQGAIPVFADVDPATLNVTAASVEAVLSERTRAIIVTHLFGNPAETHAIKALADRRGIPVIEDAAQAFLAAEAGKRVGAIGTIGCFSLQQGKHITCGEGGVVTTDDDALARRMRLFINKAWPYGESGPDHEFLALNYRMTELQGAVALAQLDKLADNVAIRQCNADRLTAALAGINGIATPVIAANAEHVYWKYCLRVDANAVPGGPPALAAALKDENILSAPRYIQKPAFECAVFRDQRTFGNSRFPFTLARSEAVDYARERFPGTYAGLRDVLVLPWNERYTNAHVDHLATAIRAHASALNRTLPEVAE
ncbi:MAG: DegT/DnrJ/EryC1/StrS family aminotransferase [Rhodobiaceae bacterium]|nr:DegT/DnrJ/EryC1/StrS family aminotransferase [Rhodobiaceae bacterium]MCC0052972.1 DegT/DnrJ/EryC1/StrS family aminotransferase [Rhodobiaceae bacterium]